MTRPLILEIANPNGFYPDENEKIKQFAGQPVDLIGLMNTDVPFRFINYRRGEHNDFIIIDYLNECLCPS